MPERQKIREAIDQYFAFHREEMLEDIKAWIRIDSTKGEPGPGAPFGERNFRMRAFAEKRLQELDFRTKNYEGYALTAAFDEKPLKLDILGHLDVVHADPDEWTITAPFEPIVKDGMIYGRGAADDKGPVIAAIYAIMAAHSLGLPLRHGVRLILGFDEESGSADIEYFYQHETPAPCTFTPDADFPLINAEKGGYWSSFDGQFARSSDLCVLSFYGGDIGNAIPGKAEAVLRRDDVSLSDVIAACIQVEQSTGVRFQVDPAAETLKLLAKGEAAHAAAPEKGKNAVTALLEVLQSAVPPAEAVASPLLRLARIFPAGETDGNSAGIAMHDENGCALTASLTVLRYDGKHINGRIDVRTPMCAAYDNTVTILKKHFHEIGLTLNDDRLCPAHYIPEDSDFVQTLLRCYEMYTGKPGKCLCSGGMTYAHHIPNAVAFGCTFEGKDNHMHGADEYAVIDELILSAKIFTQAIIELCSK